MSKNNDILTIDQLVHQDDWVNDSERYRCHVCTRNFSSFRRKHHCRKCGEVVCRNCTLYKEAELPVIGRSRVRVCMSCILAHSQMGNNHKSSSLNSTSSSIHTKPKESISRQPPPPKPPTTTSIPTGSTSRRTSNSSTGSNSAIQKAQQPPAVSHQKPPPVPKSMQTPVPAQTRRTPAPPTIETNTISNRWASHSPSSDSENDENGSQKSNDITTKSQHYSQSTFDYPLDYSWDHPWPKPPIIPLENERLEILNSFDIMDTPAEDVFDIICELASNALKCPISAVSLIDEDRQWFKASIGIAQNEIPRNVSFCAHTIISKEPLVVLDTIKDIRFNKNPLVTGAANIRFYGGAPIVTSSGHILGTVFVFDTKPHEVCDVATLEKLSNVAMKNLEDRKNALFNDTNNSSRDSNNSNLNINNTTISSSSSTMAPVATINHTNNQIVPSNNQITTTAGPTDGQLVSGAKMESMLMDLLCRTTETQQQLATQQGAMFQTLGQHTAQIDRLADAVARMEAKLDGKDFDKI